MNDFKIKISLYSLIGKTVKLLKQPSSSNGFAKNFILHEQQKFLKNLCENTDICISPKEIPDFNNGIMAPASFFLDTDNNFFVTTEDVNIQAIFEKITPILKETLINISYFTAICLIGENKINKMIENAVADKKSYLLLENL